MIKWKIFQKILNIDEKPISVTFVNLFDRNEKILHTHRCKEDSFEVRTIKNILTDAIHCIDFIEYYSCLDEPDYFDEDILRMAKLIAKKYKL